MAFISFSQDSEQTDYDVAILIKSSSFNRANLKEYYIPEELDQSRFMAADLPYGRNNKVTSAQVTDNLEYVLPYLDKAGIKWIVCADSAHYKKLTGEGKPDSNLDVAQPCKLKGYEHLRVIYNLNFASLLYNPEQKDKIRIANETLVQELGGNTTGRIAIDFKSKNLVVQKSKILDWLEVKLYEYPELAVDVETFSLTVYEAGIATISFSWGDSEGVSFPVDYVPYDEPIDGEYGYRLHNQELKDAIYAFLSNYQGSLLYHNAAYDAKVLIWECFMEHPLDLEGMVNGIECLTRSYDDTKLMAFCSMNSTSRPSKSLKDLTYEYAGSYAQSEIKNVLKIPLFTLLEYNLTDTCCTFWLKHSKLLPLLIEEDQVDVYENHFLQAQRVLLQAELHGMPMCDERIAALEHDLTVEVESHLQTIQNNRMVKEAQYILREREVVKYNSTHKVKRKTVDDFSNLIINVNSTTQLRVLLYDVLALPVLRTTKSGLPATGGKVLRLLLAHAKYTEDVELLEALISYSEDKKILNDFVPTFKNGLLKADGYRYVHGCVNLGGAASGRNSSSSPNMQNLPAKGKWGKRVKGCFVAPPGYLFVYSDFNSLEDYISALLSRDPNKLKIYLDGYDGHSIRALRYFSDEIPRKIDPSNVDEVNAIKKDFPDIRDKSKAPTFLLTYLGTAVGLEMTCGFSKQQSSHIFEAFREEYAESFVYQDRRIEEAARQGYMRLAFGLKLRCPMLHRSPNERSRYAFKQVAAEKRTLGNAMGQSYGMLNDRAVIEFMGNVWKSEHRLSIALMIVIHDASYYLIKDDIKVVKFVNDNLIYAMQWQEDPAIAHDEVRIGGELDICMDSWADPLTVPNYATESEIFAAWDNHAEEVKNKANKALNQELGLEDDDDMRDLFRDDEEDIEDE